MRTLKFESQPANVIFATVNQMFGGSSKLPTMSEPWSTIWFDYRALGSSRKVGGAAEHLIHGSEKLYLSVELWSLESVRYWKNALNHCRTSLELSWCKTHVSTSQTAVMQKIKKKVIHLWTSRILCILGLLGFTVRLEKLLLTACILPPTPR